MLRRTPRSLLIVLIASLLPSAAASQTPGVLLGRVLDESGGALPGVNVHLHHAGGEATRITDALGGYVFEGLREGRVELTFRLINFSVVKREVIINEGENSTPDTVLRLALSADIVVTARATFRSIVDVENPAENLVGIASAASQGAITARQLETRPISRPGEVLETVPGLVSSQHSGEGKANQYYLRGFNLDHGTDFATSIAGVLVNTPTGAHSHGYTDANWLIPELVSGVQFRKGPYFAEEGDFSAAGAANINYVNRLDRPLAILSTGEGGWGRALVAASPRVGGGYLLGAVEFIRNDGPWVLPEDYGRTNGLVRYSRGDTQNGFSATFMGYSADWSATDQVPRRAVQEGLLPRFGYIDATDGGSTSRQTAILDLQRSGANASTRVTGFLLRHELELFSNFTYFLDDPENGDQFEQSEQRLAVGGRVAHRRLGHMFDRHMESAVGVQVRTDWLDPIGLYRTVGRRRIATTRQDLVTQTTWGVYGQAAIEWNRLFRTVTGLRADVYQYEVESNHPLNSGSGVDAIVSPKVTAIVGPWRGSELYVNFGIGHHSNDARGAVTRIDPGTGEASNPVTPLVRAQGAEIGLRTVRVRGLQSTVALWYLGLDSELLFVGDAGTTEPGRRSRRFGVEWTNYARLLPWLTADVDISFSRARFAEADDAGPYIPGALDRVISGGLTTTAAQRFSGSVRLRHFGPRPLTEDGSVTSKATTLVNAEGGVRLTRQARVVLEGFNLFDAAVSDIDYYYASRLRGEREGVEDIHTHPALPRSFRLELQLRF